MSHVDDLKARLRRPCVRMEIGGFRPTGAPTESWFGKVLLAAPGERWPEHEGEPMVPLFQLDVLSLPFRPPALADLALVACFMGSEGLPDPSSQSGEGWLLRTYRTSSVLVPLACPIGMTRITPRPMRSGPATDDFPDIEDVPADAEDAWRGLQKKDLDSFSPRGGFKVGGWPTLVQSRLLWPQWVERPEFALQVDGEADWSWGDAGVANFGRGSAEGHRDAWFLDWQCC